MARNDASDHAEPLKLHSHRDLDDDGAPRMTRAMERYIARPQARVTRPGDLPAPLSFADAWARLHAEEPPLAAAVEQTVIHRLTVRAAAPVLGCCSATAARRKGAGLAALSIWTGLPVLAVARQIETLTA
jgi:hypothetical protein